MISFGPICVTECSFLFDNCLYIVLKSSEILSLQEIAYVK